MLVRSSLNVAAHLAVGLAFGALAVIVISRISDRSVGRSRASTAQPARERRPEPEE